MKILLVSSGSGSRGGGEIFLNYLGQGLADRGHQISVWMPQHPRMDELAGKCARFGAVVRADYRNTYDHRTRSLATCRNRGTSQRVAREWHALRPDVVHINKQNLEDGLDLLRGVRKSGLPSVCTIHLTQTAVYLKAVQAGLRDWLSRRALRRYPGVLVAVQEARRKSLHEFLGGRVRTQTIFNGVPLVDLGGLRTVRQAKRRELGLKDEDFLVLGLGRLVEQKRPFLFLKTAKELRPRLPRATFLWVGDGPLVGSWNEWLAREGLAGVISCMGWQEDALPFLAASDLLLHVAEYEGLPLAIIEAMAAGVPCAVTRNFASEIPLFDENTVLFADDPRRLAERLHNRAALEAIANRARWLVEGQLSMQAMLDSYERLYVEEAGK